MNSERRDFMKVAAATTAGLLIEPARQLSAAPPALRQLIIPNPFPVSMSVSDDNARPVFTGYVRKGGELTVGWKYFCEKTQLAFVCRQFQYWHREADGTIFRQTKSIAHNNVVEFSASPLFDSCTVPDVLEVAVNTGLVPWRLFLRGITIEKRPPGGYRISSKQPFNLVSGATLVDVNSLSME